MNVLLTGLTGFVGQHCLAHFTKLGWTCHDLPVDIRVPEKVRQVVAALQPSAVVHLAAQSSVAASFRDPVNTFQVNTIGTLNLLVALQEAAFKGVFLYVSSGDVYGSVDQDRLPIDELTPIRPRSPYAASKASGEMICVQWSQDCAFSVVIARPFNHVGPGQDSRFVVADIASQLAAIKARKLRPVIRLGNVAVTRDFTDVRDVVAAYGLLLIHGQNGEIYNICSGIERSVREIAVELARICGVEFEIEVENDRQRQGDLLRIVGSSEKLRRLTGWSQRISFSESLEDVVRFWTEQRS